MTDLIVNETYMQWAVMFDDQLSHAGRRCHHSIDSPAYSSMRIVLQNTQGCASKAQTTMCRIDEA